MVDLKQYGGEGKASYKGNKSDMKLGQHGGEGTEISKKELGGLLKPDTEYRGPGFNLKTSK